MNILFVHNTADLYGASRSLLRLSSALRRDGHSVFVVLPESGPVQTQLQAADVTVFVHQYLPLITRQGLGPASLARFGWGLLASIAAIMRVIRRYKIHLVHTNTSLMLSPALAAKLSGVRHIWHIRESFVEFPRLWRFHRVIMRRLADVVIAVSRGVGDQFDERTNIRVIHNGFPVDEFESVDQRRVDRFRSQFALEGHPLIGVVGRLKLHRKGQEVFLRAAALIRNRFPEARFVLVGSPYPGNEWHLEELKRLTHELGLGESVVFTGDVEDVKAAYLALDATVLPSCVPEPFGGVVIESMALGRPVIGTAIGGTLEQVEHEVTGYLVSPGDPGELSQAMARLLENPGLRAGMGKQARARFLERFTFAPFYQKITSVYREVLESCAIT